MMSPELPLLRSNSDTRKISGPGGFLRRTRVSLETSSVERCLHGLGELMRQNGVPNRTGSLEFRKLYSALIVRDRTFEG
jgi:hypothetical protein